MFHCKWPIGARLIGGREDGSVVQCGCLPTSGASGVRQRKGYGESALPLNTRTPDPVGRHLHCPTAPMEEAMPGDVARLLATLHLPARAEYVSAICTR